MVIYQKFAVALSEFLTVCMLQGHESYIRNPPGQKEYIISIQVRKSESLS